MFRALTLLSLVAVLGFVSVATAEDKAATGQLPAALNAMGVVTNDVVTEEEAHDVRGQFMDQTKEFNVWGDASGTINMMEGVLANFEFAQLVPSNDSSGNSSMLLIDGALGGVEGAIGANYSGGLTFEFQGKAFQETLDFSGMFSQNFFQSYSAY